MNLKTIHPHIVIIGGGAGGLELATKLGKKLGEPNKAKITLIDCSPTHLWKPLLHEIAAGTLNSYVDELNYTVHAYQHGYNFVLGQFINLDRQKKEIILASVFDDKQQEIIPPRTINYDTLIIAIGSTCNDFNTPGVKEYCLFLDNVWQAKAFQQSFVKDLLRVQNTSEPFSVAIVGAGATGIELIAELHYAVEQALRYSTQRKNIINPVEFTIIEAAPRILPALPERLSNAIHKQLEKMGVKVYINSKVTEANLEGFVLSDGTQISAHVKVWAAGVKAPDFLHNLAGLTTNRLNQIVVKPTLQSIDDDHIFAFGDCANCPQSGKDIPVPPRAQAAHQQAATLAKSLCNLLKNKPLLNYHYHDYGSLISLSHYETTGNLMGRLFNVFIEGKLARLFYISLYKMHQSTLYGFWRTFLLACANLLTRRIRPRLKLH